MSALASRSVSQIVPAQVTYEGAGFLVHRPFPTPGLDQLDPFLLLDEMGPMELEPGQAKGAPDHPHRGFETVTYLLSGEMEHRDAAGNAGRLRPGDVQWMTAGSGVVHSEMPSTEFQRSGGRMHGFQLWVNLPRRDKMIPPRYQEISGESIPTVSKDGVTVRVIAGQSLGASAVIDTRTPIFYFDVTLQAGAELVQDVPAEYNAFAYLVEGSAEIEGKRVSRAEMAILDRNGDRVRIASPEGARLLLIGGAPIGEPVARYGPFVMNTQGEIRQAMLDYQAGKMGEIS